MSHEETKVAIMEMATNIVQRLIAGGSVISVGGSNGSGDPFVWEDDEGCR